MNKNLLITFFAIVAVIVAAWLFFNKSRHFQEVEFDQNDWITTNNTYITMQVSNSIDEDSPIWHKLAPNIKLKPIINYGQITIVELPNGERGGIYASSTSQLKKYDVLEDIGVRRNVKRSMLTTSVDMNKLPSDDKARFVEYMNFKDYLANFESSQQTLTDKKMKKEAHLYNSKVVYSLNGEFYLCDIDRIVKVDRAPLTHFNRNFRLYAETEDIKSLTQQQIIDKYGDPLVVMKSDSVDVLFFRHLLTEESWYKYGTYVVCKNGGENYFETPYQSKQAHRHVTGNKSALISLTGLSWTDLPGAYWIVRNTKINLQPISLSSGVGEIYLTGFLCFIYVMALYVLLGFLLPEVYKIALFSDKDISNDSINTFSLILSSLVMIFICAHGIEFCRDCWGLVSLLSIGAIVFPGARLSNVMRFNRCKFCGASNSLHHTKVLTDSKISYRYGYEECSDKELNNSHSDGKMNVKNTIDAEDFDRYKERITTEYVIKTKYKVTKNYFDYNFNCSSCKKEWTEKEVEKNEEVVSRRKILTSQVTERLNED